HRPTRPPLFPYTTLFRSERTPLRIVPTFLGAHLLPEPGYLDLLVEEMLPVCAPLAEGCDAFCDLGALSVAEARKALDAGIAHGLDRKSTRLNSSHSQSSY